MDGRVSVLHVINGLHIGGAEVVLTRLLASMDLDRFPSEVVTLRSGGELADRARQTGTPVTSMGVDRAVAAGPLVPRLARHVRRRRPDVVQTWLYHSDLAGGLAARLAGVRAVAWGLRQRAADPTGNRFDAVAEARVCARLSRVVPARIVCCSADAASSHAAIGYDRSRMTVIHNGFDVTAAPSGDAARQRARAAIGVAGEDVVVGMVARFDPQKDHRTFAAAAGRVVAHCPDVRFVVAGPGVTEDNTELRRWLQAAGVVDRTMLLGTVGDVPSLLPAFDLMVSSSRSEGFPNTIGEAMAAGVPCVVTDVGDAAELVGDTGEVVAPGEPSSLAAACTRLLDGAAAARQARGAAARQRIATAFSLAGMARSYEDLYEEMANDVRHRRLR